MGDLVIVSNRGPFSFTENLLEHVEKCLRNGERPISPKFGEGGLVQAMAGLLKRGNWKTTWIGASMGDRDIDVARGHYRTLFEEVGESGLTPEHFPHIEIDTDNRMHFRFLDYDFYMRFVFFDTQHMFSYYSKFANGFLWPLMHLTRSPLFYKKTGTFPRPHFEKNDFVQYTSSSATFANTVIDEIRKNNLSEEKGRDVVIWNQDYHLMEISEIFKTLLREEGLPENVRDNIHVGQFMHTPFFNIHEIQGLIREDKRKRIKSEIYDPFPESIESILQRLTWGMLNNDFIGFHTKEYCDSYLAALEEWFPIEIRVADQCYEILHQDRVTTVGAFPIGLDVDKILSEVGKGRQLTHRVGRESLRRLMDDEKKKGKFLFGGLERCDYTKGLVERLGVFFYARHQLRSMNRNARLFQVTAPSRSSSPDYQNLNDVLRKEIDEVNARLPEEDRIVHLDKGIPAPQNYRFLKEVDVMLVTPLEDGMNLVAFEYILSQKYKEKKGLLVLSASGASRVLKQKGFGEEDGIVYINPLRPKEAGGRVADALKRGRRISERLVTYVEKQRRVDDWAEQNIDAIMNSRKNS